MSSCDARWNMWIEPGALALPETRRCLINDRVERLVIISAIIDLMLLLDDFVLAQQGFFLKP